MESDGEGSSSKQCEMEEKTERMEDVSTSLSRSSVKYCVKENGKRYGKNTIDVTVVCTMR